MRDIVEIGVGREATRVYDLEDISVLPTRNITSHRDVDLHWQIDAYNFDTPIIADPSDSLCSPDYIIEMGKQGMLGVFNAEGLWARWEDADEKIAEIAKMGEEVAPDEESRVIALLQKYAKEPVKKDLIVSAIQKIRDAGVIAAARVTPQHARELGPILVDAGIDILLVQGTLVSAQYTSAGADLPLDIKQLVRGTDIPVIVGGCVNYQTALNLMRTGAAGIIVGYGADYSVTTTHEVLGIHVPMASAIADAAAARRDYMEESDGRYVHVIAAGNLYNSGLIAKAIACGADAVMLGMPLARAKEAPGKGVFWPIVAGHPNNPRGRVMRVFDGISEEFLPLKTILHGPTSDPLGGSDLTGGLRRSMAKCGYTSLKKFQHVQLNVM